MPIDSEEHRTVSSDELSHMEAVGGSAAGASSAGGAARRLRQRLDSPSLNNFFNAGRKQQQVRALTPTAVVLRRCQLPCRQVLFVRLR